MEQKKINLLCRAALEKRGNQGSEVGWQGHGIGLIQQELLILQWDTDTQESAWDGGWISLLPPFFHEPLVQKSREIKRRQEERDA